jgi:hypothetical protein
MKLKTLLVVIVVLGAVDAVAWWQNTHRGRHGGEALVDRTLLELPQIERAQRIVVREKPQSKVVHKDADGAEVTLVVEKDAPIRETVLERRGNGPWTVTNCFGLEADPTWLGETLRDLTRGRLTRFVASDPELMPDLSLNLGEVRLEDGHGAIIRRIDFGRKDGGDTYQFVRIDGQDAFVAKHETELVGDPLTWVAGRVFRFEATDVREIELPFSDPGEKPLKLTRQNRTTNFLVDGEPNELLAKYGGKRAAQMLREPVMAAYAVNAPVTEAARQHIASRVRIAMFDGREYRVEYGAVPKDDPSISALKPYDERTIALGFWSVSDTNDLMVRQASHAIFGYNRNGIVDSVPKNRAALLASLAEKPAAESATSGANPP